MSNPAIKRLAIDISRAQELKEHSIFIDYDDSNITDIHVLILGPEDSPYCHGFYMFKINIKSNYPFEHPTAKYLTTTGNVRFHPNYYANGKVCLSIVGGWGDLSWTPTQTISSILINLQSILTKNAITYEPVYENSDEKSSLSINYDKYVEYYNLKFSFFTIGQKYKEMEWIPKGFHDIIEQNYKKNKKFMKNRVKELINSPDQGKTIDTKYCGSITLDYKQIELTGNHSELTGRIAS